MKTGSKLSEDEIQLYNAFVASKKAQPVAVDLAARVFQVCYIDKDTGRLYNRKLSRADFFKFITEQKDKVIWGLKPAAPAIFWHERLPNTDMILKSCLRHQSSHF